MLEGIMDIFTSLLVNNRHKLLSFFQASGENSGPKLRTEFLLEFCHFLRYIILCKSLHISGSNLLNSKMDEDFSSESSLTFGLNNFVT